MKTKTISIEKFTSFMIGEGYENYEIEAILTECGVEQ